MIHEVQICSDIDIVFMKHMNKQKVILVVVSNLFLNLSPPKLGENEPFLRHIFSTGLKQPPGGSWFLFTCWF